MTLSAEQRRAVERSGQDVCVVAGPGSGKTRVLTERFAWLVERQGVDPTRILTITFTEKAAIEIKRRLIERFVDAPELREPIERAWVSTIHGFCARLLKEHAIAAGLAPDFAVLEQAAADRLQREAAEEALDALFTERPAEMRRLLEAIDLSTLDDGRQPDLAAALIDAGRTIPPAAPLRGGGWQSRWSDTIQAATELLRVPVKGSDAGRLREWCARFLELPPGPVTRVHLESLAGFDFNLNNVGRHLLATRLKKELLRQLTAEWVAAWHAGLDGLLCEALQRIRAAYEARKRRESAVDFADLEAHTVRLLESDASVQRDTVTRFDEVLMDELQDTNRVQWRLLDLVRTRLFAVGDINQSIYAFRDADPEVFAEYRGGLRGSGAEIDELRGNYRSRAEILAAVARTLDGQDGIEPRELTAERTFAPARGAVVQRLVGRGENAAQVEAALVAARIREWRDADEFRYADMAVLVRTFAAMEPFEEAFDRFGIPFLVSGGRGFLEARETRDLTCLLAALSNPLDEIALVGVLRGPLASLRDEEILGMGHQGWQDLFEAHFGGIRRLAGFVPPDTLIARALDACGYLGGLPDRARANVDKWLAWLRREFRHRPRGLPELLDDLESLRRSESIADAPPPDTGDVVRMMTIHAAKGLEFPVVFVGALHKGPEQRSPALLYSPEMGLGVKWRHPLTGEAVSDATHAALKEIRKRRDQAEENRLLYVAMTRAMDRLVLSYAERERRASAWQKLVEAAVPDAVAAEEAPEVSPGARAAPAGATARRQEPRIRQGFGGPAEASGQYDAAVSATSVAMFAACPRRYYLSRYLGLEPEPEGPGTGAIELGLAVHRALAGEAVESAGAAALKARFEASELGRRAARASRVEREFDFLFEIEEVILRGQIDLWFEEGGETILVDYKTDRDESSASAYELQLRLYALAIERYTGHAPDRAELFYLRSGRGMEVGLGPADLATARARVRGLREAQDKLEFPLIEGDQCRKCSFWGGVCTAGREVKAGLVSLPPSSSPGPAIIGF